ncbi:type VI secretion system lipoprotein TssJ [Undibacterium sp. Jales W-56]|uniref:type VI secretion system lipoprotein TssJ n=1 Tax=Undibacterium sp. Jales W-56 TaxID=2897325 RepID=UPI0021D13FA4|nr:type VI secretion system lipoprotein TssJ [Undibacterium sp. Jales W-56]MCU6432923.1 type VI secretion system lipoprotein TssJ [Undibacterium sp. Jales W-56]
MKYVRFINTVYLAGTVSLAGCAAVSTVGSVANIALEATGLKKPDAPEIPDAQQAPRNIAIRLHASENLNVDANGRPLALVTRVYKLRQGAAFQQIPFDVFLNPQKEKELLGNDLLEVKEVMLVPGQRYEIVEKVTKEAYFIGVVALFRSPAQQRWRATFVAKEAEVSGITIGLHACALSVGIGSAMLDKENPGKLLGPVRCQ